MKLVIRKQILEWLKPFIGTDTVKVITGIRRCGKSVLLSQIRDMILSEIDPGAPIFYLDLDDEANKEYLSEGRLLEELETKLAQNLDRRTYVFLDEIHDVERWERVVNTIRMRRNSDVYITGSNSKLLSGELATYLTGRYVEFSLTPFSYAEFLEGIGKASDDETWNNYLQFGGMPFLTEVDYRAEAARRYLQDLYGSILLKDIVKRHEIRDVNLLERLTRFVMTETGHVFSARKIVSFLKNERCVCSTATILNYLKACEDAFLIKKVEREELKGKRILSVDEKYYVADCGLRNANVSANLGRDIDQLLEVVVFWEMKRRGYEITVGRINDKEVDFVCTKGEDRIYIQVAYLMPTVETREREFNALLAVPDQFDKYVLTMDRIDFSFKGIKHRFIPDFLLDERQA